MSTFALTEPPIFCRDLRYDDGERRYECHAEDGVVRPYSDNSLPRDPVGRVFSDISRQVVENSNGVFWCDGAGNDVAKITDEHCDIVAAASTKPMVPTATRDQGPSTEDSQNRRSTIRVYDLSRDVPNHIQELVIPEPSGVALTADGSGWVASTRQGLLWVSVRDSSSAVIQLFPDGIVVHWVDGTVNVSAGVRPWIMCHSGASALPVEACRGQSSAQGKHHSSW